jgi:copper chaperone CopZ
MSKMLETRRYTVGGMRCAHCERAIRAGLLAVPGVASVEVDLASKQVVAGGADLDDRALRTAIAEAGYEAA